jgi:hypothetical protein
MAMTGRLIALVGCVAYIAGMFLDYIDAGDESPNIWEAADRLDVIVLILILVALACLAGSFVAGARALPAVAAACGAAAMAFVFPADASSFNDFAIGMWIPAVAGLAVVIGSIMVAADPDRDDGGRPVAARSAPPAAPAAASADAPPAAGAPGPPPPA